MPVQRMKLDCMQQSRTRSCTCWPQSPSLCRLRHLPARGVGSVLVSLRQRSIHYAGWDWAIAELAIACQATVTGKPHVNCHLTAHLPVLGTGVCVRAVWGGTSGPGKRGPEGRMPTGPLDPAVRGCGPGPRIGLGPRGPPGGPAPRMKRGSPLVGPAGRIGPPPGRGPLIRGCGGPAWRGGAMPGTGPPG